MRRNVIVNDTTPVTWPSLTATGLPRFSNISAVETAVHEFRLVRRELKKLLQGVEDDEEIFYYLAPFREETEGDVESSPQPGGEDGEE